MDLQCKGCEEVKEKKKTSKRKKGATSQKCVNKETSSSCGSSETSSGKKSKKKCGHVRKPASEVYVCKEQKGMSSWDYAIELCKLTFHYFNLIVDAIVCVFNLLLKIVMSIFTFLQSLIYELIVAIYNIISVCAQCFAILPSLCFLCVGKHWGGCPCTCLSPFTVLRHIQVILLTLPVLVLFYYLLTWTGILDLVMTQAGYEKVKKSKKLMFSLTTDSNRRFFSYENLTSMNFFDADINTDDFNVTEKEKIFLDLLTVTTYTEEKVNFTEFDSQNINLKDISMYDTLIEYDYVSEKIDTTASAPKHQARKKVNESVPILSSRAFDKNDGQSPFDGKSGVSNEGETHNFEEDDIDYKDKMKDTRPSDEVYTETTMVTELLKTTTEVTEGFLILEEYPTQQEVNKDISSYPKKQDRIRIYDGFTGTTSNFLKALQKNLVGS